ncbi:MAG: hypothetical protein FWD57_17390, partial [Polyangiaceae bacterium]|nr:hypothetical protein [Polyangiaceae bacterium]
HFHWREVHAGGLTDFGAACAELNSKLSTEAFMQSATSCYAPVIILFTDGQPTDNWEAPLEDLKKNFWFNAAIKIAIAIGDSPDRQILAQFTGNRETVIDVGNKNVLHRLIKFVSVRASQVGSKNTGGGAATDDDKSKEIIQHLAEFQAEEHLPSNNQQNFVVAANEW